MIRIRAISACAIALGALVALAPAASAAGCTDTWLNPVSGSWNTAADWSSGVVPGSVNPNNNVCITVPGTYTVTLPAAGTTVNSLTLGGAAGTAGTQTLDIAGQAYIYGGETYNSTGLGLTSGGTVNATGALILDATAGGSFQTGNADGGSAILNVGAPLTNYGLFQSQVEDSAFQTYFSGTLTNESTGSINVASGTLTMPPGSSSGFGNTNNYAATNDGSVTVATGASLSLQTGLGSNGTFTNDGPVSNNGSITAGGGVTWTQSGGSVSGNAVVLQNGATLADSAGAGQFLFNVGSGNLTGTIPAGQTVTVRGGTYNYQGNNYSDTSVALGGATPVVNDGTLALDAPGTGNTSGGTTHLTNGTIDNFGTLVSTVEDTTWANHLQVGLVNEPGGTVKLASGNVDQDTGVPTTNHGLVTIAPGAQWALDEGGSFVNASDGTISPQIASASNVGTFNLMSPCCNGPGVVTPGGTLAPTLVGGFVPAAGQDFPLFLLNGGMFSGTFAAVGTGFTADYAHESATPAFVGAIYRASTVIKPPTPPSAHVGSISGKKGKLTVKLSCPTGGLGCSKLTITATVTEHLTGKKITAVTARATKKKNVVIASSSVALAAGGAKTLTVKLNRTGSKLLAKYGPLKVLVKVSSGGKTLQTFTVRLTKAGKASKKKKK